MIGNDLVDLKQAASDSNWHRKGYLDKLYTKEEQDLILNAAVPSSMLWLLWTMKEASYKIVNRLTGIRKYNPLSFTCSLIPESMKGTGYVSYAQYKFFIHSDISDHLIHSAAVSAEKDFEGLHLYYSENTADYIQKFNNSFPHYHLQRSAAGLPEMTSLHTGKRHAISISHHGKHLAVIYSDSLLLAD